MEKRLFKSRNIRLLFVLLGCTTTGIFVYLVAAVIIPEEL